MPNIDIASRFIFQENLDTSSEHHFSGIEQCEPRGEVEEIDDIASEAGLAGDHGVHYD